MLTAHQPSTYQAADSTAILPLLPGSDPLVLVTYQWAVAHSSSLGQLVRLLATVEPRARYRLMPGMDPNYGRLIVHPTKDGYEIDIEVSTLAWSRCGDALEPWIASALFLAFETASKGRFGVTDDSHHLRFLNESMQAAFEFQAKVRKELVASDPERLKDLPDGAQLYRSGFRPRRVSNGVPERRALPSGLK